ncbi:MAG: hypothetical protein M3Q07_13495 [Pseudobdellovibrionaceae bacterium]|nr:hypothetical protein [Pseudobdellovibrionaceae bacterium]
MGNSRVIRRKIRERIRDILRVRVPINRFSARTAALAIEDLPAALLYFPSERLLEKVGDSQERELEMRVEVAVLPKTDPEDEVFDLADQIEKALLADQGLESLLTSIDLERADFVIEADGDSVIAAAQQTYRLKYLSEEPETT